MVVLFEGSHFRFGITYNSYWDRRRQIFTIDECCDVLRWYFFCGVTLDHAGCILPACSQPGQRKFLDGRLFPGTVIGVGSGLSMDTNTLCVGRGLVVTAVAKQQGKVLHGPRSSGSHGAIKTV